MIPLILAGELVACLKETVREIQEVIDWNAIPIISLALQGVWVKSCFA
jgi:hypothetical protein